MDSPNPGWWPRIRAALIALHVVAITLQALPSPGGGMDRSSWKEPTVQDEFAAWTTRLNAVGWTGDQEQLEDGLWSFATDFVAARRAVLRPFDPYYRYCGTFQSWRMFVAPHRHPAILHVDLFQDGDWRPAYVERDPEHAWLARQLDHDRMRAQIFRLSWPKYRGARADFDLWLAQRAAEDFPEATRIRVRYWRYRTPTPAAVRRGDEVPGTWEYTWKRGLP